MSQVKTIGVVPPQSKAVSFQLLGIGGAQFIALVLFEDGTVKQVVPKMIEKPQGGELN